MSSPYIVQLLGSSIRRKLKGKAAVGEYWRRALERMPTLHFELIDTVGVDSVVLVIPCDSQLQRAWSWHAMTFSLRRFSSIPPLTGQRGEQSYYRGAFSGRWQFRRRRFSTPQTRRSAA